MIFAELTEIKNLIWPKPLSQRNWRSGTQFPFFACAKRLNAEDKQISVASLIPKVEVNHWKFIMQLAAGWTDHIRNSLGRAFCSSPEGREPTASSVVSRIRVENESDPSPVSPRLMRTPQRATLSPKESL